MARSFMAAHKIALQPTKAQEAFFRQSAGVQRFAYNWGLARWEELYKADKAAGVKTVGYAGTLQKELDATKREKWPWMLEVSKGVPQGGLQNLDNAFKAFFKGQGKYPKFKKKGVSRDSFRADGNGTPESSIKFSGKYIRFAKLKTWVRGAEKLRFTGKMQRVSIVREADRWFAVFVVDTPGIRPIVRENQATVGIDLGLTTFATTSDGEVFESPKPLKMSQRKLVRAQRVLARRVKGSGRRRAAKLEALALSAREWICPDCGANHDRDLNAAKNLAAYAALRADRPEVTRGETATSVPDRKGRKQAGSSSREVSLPTAQAVTGGYRFGA